MFYFYGQKSPHPSLELPLDVAVFHLHLLAARIEIRQNKSLMQNLQQETSGQKQVLVKQKNVKNEHHHDRFC